jgi:hypothetical protein
MTLPAMTRRRKSRLSAGTRLSGMIRAPMCLEPSPGHGTGQGQIRPRKVSMTGDTRLSIQAHARGRCVALRQYAIFGVRHPNVTGHLRTLHAMACMKMHGADARHSVCPVIERTSIPLHLRRDRRHQPRPRACIGGSRIISFTPCRGLSEERCFQPDTQRARLPGRCGNDRNIGRCGVEEEAGRADD